MKLLKSLLPKIGNLCIWPEEVHRRKEHFCLKLSLEVLSYMKDIKFLHVHVAAPFSIQRRHVDIGVTFGYRRNKSSLTKPVRLNIFPIYDRAAPKRT